MNKNGLAFKYWLLLTVNLIKYKCIKLISFPCCLVSSEIVRTVATLYFAYQLSSAGWQWVICCCWGRSTTSPVFPSQFFLWPIPSLPWVSHVGIFVWRYNYTGGKLRNSHLTLSVPLISHLSRFAFKARACTSSDVSVAVDFTSALPSLDRLFTFGCGDTT